MGVVGLRIDPLTGRPLLPVSGIETWSPFYLGSALLGFWDAQEASSLTLVGTAVTTWADRVGGYAPTQATVASKPVYSPTSFYGRPGITFDGTDDYLDLATTPAAFPTGAAASEIWALVDQTAAGGSAGIRCIAGYGAGNTNRYIGRVTATSTNRAWAAIGNGGTVQITDTNTVFSGRHVIRGQFGASSSSVGLDGATSTSGAVTPTTGGNPLRIGSVQSTSLFFQGIISAILVTNPLTTDQATQLTRWLKWRGGIA